MKKVYEFKDTKGTYHYIEGKSLKDAIKNLKLFTGANFDTDVVNYKIVMGV